MGSQVENSQVLLRSTERTLSGVCHSPEYQVIATERGTYHLQCVDSLQEMADIKRDWTSLHAHHNRPFSYFQSFDWCFGWARNFCDQGQNGLRVFVLRTDDAKNEIVLIWPMASVRSKAMANVLVSMSDPLGQYSGFLYDDTHVDYDLAKKVFERVLASSEGDAISIMNCPEGSLLAEISREYGYLEKIQPNASILDLHEIPDWDAYHASLPRNSRKERNKRRNKLASKGALEYEVVAAGSDRYRELVQTCLDFKQVWLAETGRRAGVLADIETARYFADLASETANGKIVSGAVMHCLSVDGEPIGLEMGMIWNGDYYSYLGAIDWEWRAYSPGKVQMEFAQRWAKEAGLKRFDFLSDPSDYKAYWTNTSQSLVSLNIPITLKGQLYCRVWKAHLKPKLKQFYHKTAASNRIWFNRAFYLLSSKKSERLEKD